MNDHTKSSGESTVGPAQTELEEALWKKLEEALTLKDYAINANLDVDDDIIEKLNKASKSLSLEHASDIDKALRDLTSITYPTTVETLRVSRGPGGLSESAQKLMFWLLVIAPVVLLVALVAVWQEQAGKYPVLWQSLIALCLGMLGSVVYIFFNLIGVMVERAFTPDDTYSNSIRLVLGAIVGWVFFYAFCRGKSTPVLLLLPFAAGYSTRLVVGLINQVIRALELTLGLEDKTTSLLKRKARRK